MSLGNGLRIAFVLAAGLAAAGSATSTSNNPPPPNQYGGYQNQQSNNQPPPAQPMEASTSLGVWQSNFGAVKIEADNSRGGLQSNAVQGVWVYTRQGQEVIGYFSGALRGNILDFRWQEPANPPLTGAGFIVFDTQGRQFNGRWWSDRRDRTGDWYGSRSAAGQQGGENPYPQQQGQVGGQTYGGQNPYPQQPAYPQPQPYPQQGQYPQQQPYPAQQGQYPQQPYRQPQPSTPPPRPYY